MVQVLDAAPETHIQSQVTTDSLSDLGLVIYVTMCRHRQAEVGFLFPVLYSWFPVPYSWHLVLFSKPLFTQLKVVSNELHQLIS